MGDDFDERKDNPAELVKHEYGHSIQFAKEGVLNYTATVAIPSVANFWISEYNEYVDKNYYSFPWEYQAELYGNVSGREYTGWASTANSIFSIYRTLIP